jgi:hypothetical protein
MNGFISKTVLTLAGAGALAATQGCYHYREIVDPCYPERYEYAARQEVKASFAPQVQNGHVLDQTVWNYQFAPGSEQLTQYGLDHLAYLARRRPTPDPVIYLQTAQDIPYDGSAPGKFADARAALDGKRIKAIQDCLTAQTAGRPVAFQVVVHDPSDPSISAASANVSVQKMNTGAVGILPIGGGGGSGGGSSGGGK